MGCVERHIENGQVVSRPCGGGQAVAPEPADGPGTELKVILRDWFGITASASCSCNAMARQMNVLGPDWCDGDGMPHILSAMRGEHAKRRKAGKTRIPWSDTGAAMLVRLACRRARRNSSQT